MSIRLKITLSLSAMLIVITGITFILVRYASQTVLRSAIRDYLIGTVEENVSEIYYTDTRDMNGSNIYIPYKDGFLGIDEDYMEIVNDVYTALYSTNGTMLYGEDPIAGQTETLGFTVSCTRNFKLGNTGYIMYDRKLDIELPDNSVLWIRGIVPETKTALQLKEITRIFLVLLPVLMIISVMSAYLFADKMLAPIRKIEAAARRISRGEDLKERINIEKNYDEIGRLAVVFNDMLDRLEHSFEIEKQFTSDASHELRTPASVILAQCEYTLEKLRSTEEYEEALNVIQKQGRRMRKLISDMLEYTRMDHAISRYPMKRINISEIVSETSEQLSVIGSNDITLSAEIEPDITIIGNKLLISRLTANLISNAYCYGRQGGHTIVKLEKDGRSVILSVADDGIGISEEVQGKIFDRFYRVDESRSAQGTGLGLSMVKKIAELHNTEVVVESEKGKGSIFKIYFKL